jgi:hypothetical protein
MVRASRVSHHKLRASEHVQSREGQSDSAWKGKCVCSRVCIISNSNQPTTFEGCSPEERRCISNEASGLITHLSLGNAPIMWLQAAAANKLFRQRISKAAQIRRPCIFAALRMHFVLLFANGGFALKRFYTRK